MLLLIVLAGAAVTLMLFNDSRFLGFHPAFPFYHSPIAEALKLLLVAGVILVILAGMGFVVLGVVPLALVAVGSVFLLQWMHGTHHFPGWIIMGSVAAAAVLLIFLTGMKSSHRRTKIINDEV
ncbi:MAG TPA: hypothetical protein VHR86_05695 [Armatimonadota bacterium]|nr:hypothetical protein [Armatimonadota bacterium]